MHLSWKRMQWLRFKRFLKESKGPMAALLSGLLIVFTFWLTRSNRFAMTWFVQKVSSPWKRFWGGLADSLPFSVAELLGTLLVVWLIVMGVRTLYEWRVQVRRVLGRRLIGLCAVLVWIYAGFCLTWGVHYYTDGFTEKSGIAVEPVSVEQLESVTRYFAQQASRTAALVQRDENGRFVADNQRILEYGDACYAEVVKEWTFLEGPHRTPKPGFYSAGMSAVGFTGYLFPFLGESTVNVHCPNVYLPVTVAHEMAHQRGVAPEQEANFLGIAACVSSPDPDYQYSGWLFGYSHLSNALYSADPDALERVREELSEDCRTDLSWNDEYWADFRSPVSRLVQGGYSGFLQSYGQTLGLKSYGACVDLLVAYYDPAAAE